jgi:hypothetical protein
MKPAEGAGASDARGFKTGRHLTTSSQDQACVLGGLSSSSNTARASLSWSLLREVSARRNRH